MGKKRIFTFWVNIISFNSIKSGIKPFEVFSQTMMISGEEIQLKAGDFLVFVDENATDVHNGMFIIKKISCVQYMDKFDFVIVGLKHTEANFYLVKEELKKSYK